MSTGDLMPNPQEVVGYHFDGDIFCRTCYGGRDKSQPIVFQIAHLNRSMVCMVCKKRLSEVAS